MNPLQRELSKLRRQQHLLYILVFFFVAVIIWVGISLFSSQKKTAISPELLELAKPLTPTINRSVLQDIANKKQYTAAELEAFPIFKIVLSADGREELKVRADQGILNPSAASPAALPSAPLVSSSSASTPAPSTGDQTEANEL